MSLAIDTNKIVAVLIGNGWYEVVDRSFDIDSYEFVEDNHTVHMGGAGGTCSTGFMFRGPEGWMMGPLTSILAVRTEEIQ